MATNNKRNVTLTLGVETTGTDSVQQLAGDLKNVAAAGTSAAPGVEKLTTELTALETHTAQLQAVEAAARSEVVQTRAARDLQRDALARLRAETDTAGRATDEFKIKERELKLSIIDSGTALRDKQKALSSAVTSARISAVEETKLTAKIQELNVAYRQLGAVSSTSAAQQTAAHVAVGDGLQTLKGQLSSLQNVAMAAVGGTFIGGLAKDVAETADAYNNLQACIKLVTGEGVAFQTAFEGVTAVAQLTSSSLASNGNLFTKIADAGKAMGVGQADALRLTETINQAVQLSGARAQASDAAIVQLIQSLQSGVLRGDEFNSIMEQAPRLSRALAEGLSVTTGELRKMAEAGALSSDVVIKALRGQSDVVASEFSKLPPTVGRAIQNLATSWTLYVGETDRATGASTMAASAVMALAANLKTVAGYLTDASQAGALFVALKLAQYFATLALAAGQSATAVTANTAAITATSAASTTAAATVGRFASILSGLKTLTFVGLVSNFHDIGVAIGEGAAKLAGYRDKTDELARSEKVAAQIAADTVAMRKRMAEATQDAIDKTFQLSIVAKAGIAEFDTMTKSGTGAAEAIAKIGKDFDLASVQGIKNATAVLDKLLADGKLSASEFQGAWATALKGEDLAVFEAKARAALAGTSRESERLAQILDVSVRTAIMRTGLDFDLISGGMGKATRSAINDTDALIGGLDRLKAMGVDTAAVLTASLGKGINTADSQKAVEAVKLQIEAVRKVLGDKVTDGLLDQAKQKALDLKDALDKSIPGITSLHEAMKDLGVTSDQTFKDTAAKSKAAYETMRASGTASARELSAGFQKYASDAIAASGEVGSTQRAVTEAILKSEAAARGLTVAFEANGQMSIKSQGEAAAAIDRTTGAINTQSAALQNLKEITSAPNGGVIKSVLTPDDMKGVDNTGLDSLQNKRNGGTLGASDLTTAQAVFDAAKTNLDVLQKNWGVFGMEGQQSAVASYNAARSILDQVKAMSTTPGAPTAGGASNSTVVNVNIAGRNTPVNVVSQTDANNLTSILRQLETGMSTAA